MCTTNDRFLKYSILFFSYVKNRNIKHQRISDLFRQFKSIYIRLKTNNIQVVHTSHFTSKAKLRKSTELGFSYARQSLWGCSTYKALCKSSKCWDNRAGPPVEATATSWKHRPRSKLNPSPYTLVSTAGKVDKKKSQFSFIRFKWYLFN